MFLSVRCWEYSNDPCPLYFCESIAIQTGGVSWYKLVYILLSAERRAYFCKSIAIEVGGVYRDTFQVYQGQGSMSPHQRRRFFVNFFCPKNFDCPTCSQLRAFSGSPWARELQNTLLEQTSTEGTSLWGLCVDFWFCSTDSGVDSRKKRCGFLFRSWRGFRVDFFSPFFPVPKNPHKIHARIHTKIHANFENIFPTGFSGCSALVYVAAIGCPYLHVNKPRLASLTLRARNFQWHKPEMVDSVNLFSKGKIHAKSTLSAEAMGRHRTEECLKQRLLSSLWKDHLTCGISKS